MHHTDEVQQSLEEVQGLLAHLETASWVEEDWGILQRVLRSYARLLGTPFRGKDDAQAAPGAALGTRRRRRTSSASDACADMVDRREDAGAGVGGGGQRGRRGLGESEGQPQQGTPHALAVIPAMAALALYQGHLYGVTTRGGDAH